MAIRSLALSLTLAVAVAAPAPTVIAPRAVIAHDAVVGFAETVPNDNNGRLMLQFKPFLHVINGCVPFPAVDAAGNTGGGLNPSGSSNGGCSKNTGQVYARTTSYNGYQAIMYSWYMPKDSPSDGLGHRHDWENAIVWISNAASSPTLAALSTSAHGDYDTTKSPKTSDGKPLVGYVSTWPVNHQLKADDEVGGTQPLIAWESMTAAARSAIETTDFGSATPSFRDSNFESYLAKAYAQL